MIKLNITIKNNEDDFIKFIMLINYMFIIYYILKIIANIISRNCYILNARLVSE